MPQGPPVPVPAEAVQLSEMSEANAGGLGEWGSTAGCLKRLGFTNTKHTLRTRPQFAVCVCACTHACAYIHVSVLPNTLNVCNSECRVEIEDVWRERAWRIGGIG